MKRFLAMLLAVVMVVSLLPVGVFAEGSGTPAPQAEGHIHKVCKGTTQCTDCSHTDVTYATAWGDDGNEASKLPTASGTYYLTNDLVLDRGSSSSINTDLTTTGLDIKICLNGYNIRAKDGKTVRFLHINAANINLTISNCGAKKIGGTDESGCITGAKDVAIMVNNNNGANGKIELYNVAVHNNHSAGSNAGAIQVQKTTSMKAVDCIFQNNTSATGTGAIRMYSTGALEMIGCTFTDNRGKFGYALRADKGSVSLTDTVIEGNYSTDSSADSAAVHLSPEETAATKNKIPFTVQGSTRILSNSNKATATGTGAARDLYLKNAVNQIKVKIGTNGLAEDAKIGVYLPVADRLVNDPYITDALSGVDYTKNFEANNDGYQIIAENDKLVMKVPAASGHSHKVCKGVTCADCGHNENGYLPWGNKNTERTSLPASGSYYLTEDVTLESRVTMDGTTLNLCLNGHTVSIKEGVSTSHFLLKNGAKLNITNCSETEEGILTGAKSCAIQIYGTSAVELYNVVLEDNSNVATGTYDGGGAVQLFDSATLKAVSSKFRNNTAAKSAGAVLLRGSGNQVTLINCEVKDNTASIASAIRVNKGSKLTLDGTVVENNQATSTNAYNYGAVFAVDGSCALTVQGATRITGNTNGNDEAANAYFLNSAGNQPVITIGASGLSGDAMIGVTMETSRINNDRSFSGNLGNTYPVNYFTSDNGNYIVVRKAGKLYMEDAAKAHEHSLCKAENCSCGNHEKMLFSPWGETAAEKKALPVSGCYYLTEDVTLESRATIDATSLNLCLNGHTVTIKDGVSTSHFLLKNGAKLNVTNCSDTKEGVLTGAKSCALQIYDTSAVELYNVILENNSNTATGSNDGGGAVQLFNSATLKAVSCKFRNNTAAKAAGAVLLRGNGNQVALINCEVKGNTASMASAIRVNGGSKLTLDNTVVEQNQNTATSNYNYGAVFAENASCVVTVQGATRIINNTNGNNAPANLYMQHKDGNQMVITVGEQGLSGNAMIGVTLESGRLKIADGRVVSAKLDGKDVAGFFCYDTNEYETLVKDDVVIVEEFSDHKHCLCNTDGCTEHAKLKFIKWTTANKLPDSGNYYLETDVVLPSGAHVASELNLCLNGHTITFEKDSKIGFYMKSGAILSITDCKDIGKITGGEKNYGGVINVSEGSTFNLYGGTLTGNKVIDMTNDKGKGGAVYLSKASSGKPGGVFNMYGGAISDNEAYRGGAVYMCAGSTMNMYGGTISKNTATYRGGAITNDGVVAINIHGGTISGNTAENGAAAYLCGGATMTVTGGEISGNTGTSAGGAILVESKDTKLSIQGGKFTGNSTTSDGGAIYASRNTVFEMTGGEISGNKANNGGAIYINEAAATISGGTVKGNQATADGGAIVSLKSDFTLSGGEISGNIAKANGGGVFLKDGTVQLSGNPVIKDNQAGGKNSNLYLPGKTVFTVGAMGANAKVGISAERVYGAMSAKTETDCTAAFVSDNSALKVIYKDKTVYLEPVEGHAHCLCNDQSVACKHGTTSFAPWTDATTLPREGNFYLTTDVVLTSAAYAAADLNLCLNGHTISIKAEDRIINLRNGTTLSIADCKGTGVVTGGVHNYGGVINVSLGSTFNLYGGSLTGNKVLDVENDRGKAGAVYMTKTDGKVPGGVFNMYGGAISGNEAYRGGAVFACDGSTFNMYGGTIANNKATYRGGAIANENVATINIHGGTFTGNTAKNGAVFYICNGATMTMTDGLVTKNTTTGAGSVLLIESQGTKVVIKGGKIAENSTPSDGTVYVSRNTIFEMSGGSIENNTAKSGAGVYVNESSANISGGSIKGNKAAGSGGGVYFNKPVSGLISGGNITHNQAQSYGGGVYIYNNSKATISGGSVSYNTSVKGAGGGVCMMGGSLDLKGGTIGYNQNLHKSNKGGGIMMYGGTLYMTNGYIVGNKVNNGVSGAGICCTTIGQTKNGVKTDRPSKITMYGGTIADHVGNYGGGVILQSKTVMNVYGGTFRNNEAKGDGGAIYLNGKSVLNVYNATMTGNKAANRGGAICYFTNTSGEITGGTIKDNYAGGYGGSIAAHGIGTKIAIKNMKFSGCKSDNYGGAVSISWNAAMDMENCEIYENEAFKGGAMYLAHKTAVNLTNVKLYKNSSTETGGAVYLDVGNTINFTNVKVMDNEAGTNGGGIYTRANLHLKDCLIDGNTAGNNGGGIATGMAFTYGHTYTNGYVGRGQGLIIEDTKVTNNSCVASGGGTYMARQNWNTIINSEFTGNTCGETGSGLFVADDLITKGTVLISGNTSKTDGYAVYFNENSYDGQSHSITTHEIGGNVIVKDNIGGEVMLCKDVSLGTTAEGYGKDTYFNITLSDGLLTNRVFGAYNYEGEDLIYTITYGTRSLDEPMEADITEETGSGNVWLYAGVGVFAVAVIAVVVALIVVKKKKAGTPAETPQE